MMGWVALFLLMGLGDVYPSHNSVYKPAVTIIAYERNPGVIAPIS